MKYYIISGEASGDLHGANLMKSLRKEDPQAQFRCWGGDLMQAEGATLVKHYRDLAFMGFAEVVSHLGEILRNFKLCKEDMLAYRPDVVILIDYPGFNMRMMKFAHKQGFKVVYYIAPQVWAWRTGRIKQLKKYTHQIYTLLPFERKFYQKYGATALYEGNPLVDAVAAYKPDEAFVEKFRQADERPIVLMLPGSRKQEIERIFPLMLKVADKMPQYRLVAAGTKHLPEEIYHRHLQQHPQVELVFDHTYDLFSIARAGMIKSGTSTLEAALFSVPQVVCYRTSAFSYRLARCLMNKEVRFYSLVNLIMDAPVVCELVQRKYTEKRLEKELENLLVMSDERKKMLSDYIELQKIMGDEGVSDRVASSLKSVLLRYI